MFLRFFWNGEMLPTMKRKSPKTIASTDQCQRQRTDILSLMCSYSNCWTPSVNCLPRPRISFSNPRHRAFLLFLGGIIIHNERMCEAFLPTLARNISGKLLRCAIHSKINTTSRSFGKEPEFQNCHQI
jgi:hypothetical protein